jgi:hypothetical protein
MTGHATRGEVIRSIERIKKTRKIEVFPMFGYMRVENVSIGSA